MPTPIKAVATIQDEKGETSNIVFYTDLDLYGGFNDPVSDLLDYMKEVLKRLDLIIGGVITGMNVSLPVDLPSSLKLVPDADSDVEEKARFSWYAPGAGTAFQHEVPTFYHYLFPSGAIELDPGETTELTSYVGLLYNPTEALNWAPEYGGLTESRGERCTEPPRIKKVFRRR